MADQAVSDDPRVQAQLDRLNAMTAGHDKLGRKRLRRLLERLGDPHLRMPPVFHVAGTNGKGSVCTYLREAIAAAGMTAHVYTSPHLVRLNERIRIANQLVSDEELARLLSDTLDAVGNDETTFFEATTAAAFLAFSRHPADACIVEVGIGGRLDATNVIPDAIACGIAEIGIDHQEYLGNTVEEIASEKAGIAKPGAPLVTLSYKPPIEARIAEAATAVGAPILAKGRDWDANFLDGRLHYRDAEGAMELPMPALVGAHQADNAGLAIAMMRHQQVLKIGEQAIETAMIQARWPARLSLLGPGPVTDQFAEDSQLWLDGAHNVTAMEAVVEFMQGRLAPGAKLHIIFALLDDKDAHGVMGCFGAVTCDIITVPIAGYHCRPPGELCAIARELNLDAREAADFAAALKTIGDEARLEKPLTILITGSLYLAGQVLRFNRQVPD